MQTALLASCSLIEMAIEPKLNADRPKLSAVLFDLAAQDPSFRVTTDADVGQTILGGLSETHLEDKINILKHAYKIDANIGAPQVACREKLSRRGRRWLAKQTGPIDPLGAHLKRTNRRAPFEVGSGN